MKLNDLLKKLSKNKFVCDLETPNRNIMVKIIEINFKQPELIKIECIEPNIFKTIQKEEENPFTSDISYENKKVPYGIEWVSIKLLKNFRETL